MEIDAGRFVNLVGRGGCLILMASHLSVKHKSKRWSKVQGRDGTGCQSSSQK